jgi:hypothetical protein
LPERSLIIFSVTVRQHRERKTVAAHPETYLCAIDGDVWFPTDLTATSKVGCSFVDLSSPGVEYFD